MQLIVFAGLPGTGKSSVAESVGYSMAVPVFAKDWLEGVIVRCVLESGADAAPQTGFVGYELLTMLADRQLRLGQSAILDSVASTETIRVTWRSLAAKYGADFRVIECVCSDVSAHRSRIRARERGIPGWHELTWSDVEIVASKYAPWIDSRLTLDARDPFPENVARALTYLRYDSSLG